MDDYRWCFKAPARLVKQTVILNGYCTIVEAWSGFSSQTNKRGLSP